MSECEKVLEEFKAILDTWHHHKHLPKRLGFKFTIGNTSIEVKGKEIKMQFSGMSVGWTVSVIGVGLNADGTVNPAVLSNVSYQTGDATVATVAPDPNNPNGAIITLVATPPSGGSSTTTLTETATATLNGATGVVTGSDTLIFSGETVPPPVLPTSIGFQYGTPVAPGAPTPPPPPVPAGKKF